MTKKKKQDEGMEELYAQMPEMTDEEREAFMKEHEAEPIADDEENETEEQSTAPDGEAESEGGPQTQEDDGEADVDSEEPDGEEEDYGQGKSVPYAALKEERTKRKSESEKAKQYESQLDEIKNKNEELQRQFMEMQRQLLEAANANRQQTQTQEQAGQEEDPLRDAVLGYVKPLIEPIQQERQQKEEQQKNLQQLRGRAVECEKRAREKYEDYDNRTKGIFEFAKQKASQGDPSYVMDILNHPDPAEYAYTLSYRLEAHKPKEEQSRQESTSKETQNKYAAIAKHPRSGMIPGGSGGEEASLEGKMAKIHSGEMSWTDLTKEEQNRLLRGKF